MTRLHAQAHDAVTERGAHGADEQQVHDAEHPSTMKPWAPVAGGSAKGSGTPKSPRAMTTAMTQSMRMPTRRTPKPAIEPGPLCGRPRR